MNKYLEKAANAPTQVASGLGQYLLHNAVVPGAVIFGADLGAHIAADKLEAIKKHKAKLQKSAELSLMDKYKSSSGYKDPHATGAAGAFGTATFLGGGLHQAAKGLSNITGHEADKAIAAGVGDPARVAKLKAFSVKAGKAAMPAAVFGTIAGGVLGHKAYSAFARSRNKELDTKATSNPEFRARLEKSPDHWLSHPALDATLGAAGDIVTGSPALAAANFAAGAYEGVKSDSYTLKRLQRLKDMDKKASVLATVSKMTTKIKPTIGVKSTKSQANALKSNVHDMPSPPIMKQAGLLGDAANYGWSAAKGVGSLTAGGLKSFGSAFSGQEARGVVAKKTGLPLYPSKLSRSEWNKHKGSLDKLYRMDDTAMRSAVQDSTEHLNSLNRAIDRRTGARVVAGAAGLAALSKLNEPPKERY